MNNIDFSKDLINIVTQDQLFCLMSRTDEDILLMRSNILLINILNGKH